MLLGNCMWLLVLKCKYFDFVWLLVACPSVWVIRNLVVFYGARVVGDWDELRDTKGMMGRIKRWENVSSLLIPETPRADASLVKRQLGTYLFLSFVLSLPCRSYFVAL